MATTEFQARTPSTASERRHGAAWWVVALVAALAVAVGFGVGYLIFGQDSTSEGNAEAEAVVDDFVAALNAYDTEALRALATQDAVLADRDLSVTGALGYDTRITEWEAAGYTFETIGEPIVVDISDGLGSEFRVAQACVVKDRDGTEISGPSTRSSSSGRTANSSCRTRPTSTSVSSTGTTCASSGNE